MHPTGAKWFPVGAGNSAVVVDLPRCGPMLSPRAPNLVPIPGPRMERETPVGAGNSAVVVDVPRCGPMLSPRGPHYVPIPGITGSARCAVRPLEGP